MVRDTRTVKYQKKIKQVITVQVGDIAYWDGSSVKTTPLSSWNTSLGTPVGVVVIKEGFLPDGKARIISLTSMNNGNKLRWDRDSSINSGYKDSPVPNIGNVPTTDNAGSTSTGSNRSGHLPSDRSDWSGPQSYVDSLARYYGNTPMIPSPYLGDEFNPTYAVELVGGNVLSDFNGLSNTQLLVNEGTRYVAANACWNYKDATNGADGLQWYLPAMGELGFLIPRYELINTSIQAVGGTPFEVASFLSSSEHSEQTVYTLDMYDGDTFTLNKISSGLVRAVSIV